MASYRELVFSKKAILRVVNLVDFRGADPDPDKWIHAYGFDKEGNPVTNPHVTPDYAFCGSFIGTVEWSPLLVKGIKLGALLGISEKEAKNMIKGFKNVKQLNFIREMYVYGMLEPYNCSDKYVLFVNEIPHPDYDRFNEFLKKIKSEWRIVTPKVNRLLMKLEFQRIMGSD